MCSGLAGGVGCAFVGSGFFLLCSGAAGVRGFLLLRVWASVRLETAFRSCEISSACFPSLSASSEICSRSAATSSVLSSRRRLAAGGGVGGSEPGRPCFSLLWFIANSEGGLAVWLRGVVDIEEFSPRLCSDNSYCRASALHASTKALARQRCTSLDHFVME